MIYRGWINFRSYPQYYRNNDCLFFYIVAKYSFNLSWLSEHDLRCQSPRKRNLKHLLIVRWRVCMCLCGGAAPHLWGSFGLCLTAKHKPFCQTNKSCVGERGGPGPNCRAGHSLTAAFILLLFLLHTQGFLGFLKYFSHSVLPLPPSIPPLFLSFCHRALIGCYDRAVAGLSASSKAQFNYSFSPTWHVHAQMHANSHTREGKVTNTHADTQTDVPSCTSRHPGSNEKKASVIELSVSHSTWQSRPPDVPQQSFENTM